MAKLHIDLHDIQSVLTGAQLLASVIASNKGNTANPQLDKLQNALSGAQAIANIFEPTAPIAHAAPPPPIQHSAPVQFAPVAQGVELDSQGVTWDERIHSSTKSKNQNGTWKIRRGTGAIATANNAAPPPPMQHNAPPPVIPASAPQAPPPPITTNPAIPATFDVFMPRISTAITSGILTNQDLTNACAAVGLPSIVSLQSNPVMIPNVWASLKQQFPALV